MLYTVKKTVENRQLAEMIYMDKRGVITKRRVKVQQVRNDYIRGYCYLRKSNRLFSIQNILAISPVLEKESLVV